MAYIRPYRTSRAKGPGLPLVDWNRVPRGLTSNPLFQCNQCPDVVGNVPAYSWWQGDRGLVPTQWGLGLNAYFSQVSYPIPRSQLSQQWSRAVLFKTPSSVGAWGLCGDTGYGSERNLSISSALKPEGYFWPSTPVTLTGTTTLQGNTLYMIVMTYGAGVATLYLNGVQEAQSSGYSDNPFYAATTQYGSNGANGGDGGAILAGYGANVCWTAAEVAALWNAPFAHLIFQDEPAFWTQDRTLVTILRPVGSDVTVSATGQAATFTAGTAGVSHAQALTGDAATASAGTVAPKTTVALAGQAATFSAGTVVPSPAVSASGQEATFTAGTMAPSSAVALAGEAATFAAGTVSVPGDVTVALTGAEATFAAGTLTADTSGTGDTHDGFVRRSRRQRALDAAERRRREAMAQEAVALRLSLEAAMGMADEVAEEAPAEAVEAVQAVAKRAARLVPTLADTKPDEALLASAREAVTALRAAVQEAERARALAEDDEEVLMLLRAL